MECVITVLLALAAGLHAALYGAWKDSPHENFRPTRFWRELALAAIAGLFLCRVDHLEDPFIVMLSAFAVTRITTEFYKLFLRREAQEAYRIPTQVHIAKRVVRGPARVVLGLMWLAAIYGLYALLKNFPDTTSPHIVGPVAGLLFGGSLAVGGAYKDGYIEGFKWRKFIKSPMSGAIGGLLVSFHTSQLEFLVLGTIALERMINELVYKLMKPGYIPGKFRLQAPPYPEWFHRRRLLLLPYALTWALVIGLWFWRE
jgi:hypothetical protein